MDDIDLILDDLDAWDEFAAANEDALRESYGSSESAYQHAIQGGLTLGGGAAPLVIISFA